MSMRHILFPKSVNSMPCSTELEVLFSEKFIFWTFTDKNIYFCACNHQCGKVRYFVCLEPLAKIYSELNNCMLRIDPVTPLNKRLG